MLTVHCKAIQINRYTVLNNIVIFSFEHGRKDCLNFSFLALVDIFNNRQTPVVLQRTPVEELWATVVLPVFTGTFPKEKDVLEGKRRVVLGKILVVSGFAWMHLFFCTSFYL